MKIFVAGSTGATGKHLVKLLLDNDISVKTIVRTKDRLHKSILENKSIEIVEGNILDLEHNKLADFLKDCDAIVSCLGHNISFKGIYGKPRRLVKESIEKLYTAIEIHRPVSPKKLILMNTTGNRNKDINEKVSTMQKIIVGILRYVLPPQADNEEAAEYLVNNVGKDNRFVEWVAVRPDGLIDDNEVSEYAIFQSPIRDAIFDAGKIARINVAHFMSELITKEKLWLKWKGQMPVIYDIKYANTK